MRSLLAPARLQALFIAGGLVTLLMMTQDSCTWLDYSDEDSVPQLSEARLCELARQRTGVLPDAKCTVARSTAEMAEVHFEGERTVCFLKAARWFVSDVDTDDCPLNAPRERAHTLRQEQNLEEQWLSTLRAQRDVAAHTTLVEHLAATLKAWDSATEVPKVCPAFDEGKLEVVDADLVQRAGGAWHYLTSDRVERLVESSGAWGAAAELRGLRRNSATLLFVRATEKIAPFQNSPGTFRGKVALVDWWNARVLCETELEFEQPTDAPTDAEAVALYMPSFKESLVAALRATALSMSNGQLQLADTY